MTINQKPKLPFSHLNFENWQNLIMVGLFIFYLSQFGFLLTKESFLRGYGVDYLAFWSIGKIADEKGFAEIYDIENIRATQTQVLVDQEMLKKGGTTITSPIPAPFFSFFVPPFQLLSRIDPKLSYWIWTSINLAILVSFLFFFLRKTLSDDPHNYSAIRILLLMLLSFPMIVNLTEGQVEVFLVVCVGEFIRYALKKKPLSSGLWLGGLLLKPQLLIIIIPILLFQRNWKVLAGFFATSGVIIGSSMILGGIKGLKSLINLWFKYGEGIASNSPERMINWRMVAANLDSLIGWAIAILGMALTLIVVFYFVKNNITFGSDQWVMFMLGIFSATLAITWHSHFHMASVLIPFLIYCSLSRMLNKKVVLFWAVSTPVILMVVTVAALFLYFLTKVKINDFGSLLLGLSGFFSNLVILGAVMQYFHVKKKTPETPKPKDIQA